MNSSKNNNYNGCEFNKCSVAYTLSIVGGKWKWVILSYIAENGVIRYGELKSCIKKIAHKTLSQQLKEMENSGIIHRKQYNQVPPKVEYSLTKKGETLIPILELMSQWGKENQSEN